MEGLPPSPAQHRNHQRDLLHRNLQSRSWRTVVRVPHKTVVRQTLATPLSPSIWAGPRPTQSLGDVFVQD